MLTVCCLCIMTTCLSSQFATLSIGNFPYMPAEEFNGDQCNIANAVTGRKTWKTTKEKKEVVWPPCIEAALLEALEQYRPATSRDPEDLQRFPRRNRFISDYIKQATGTTRTPKQVGSRLQQLRDTCSDPRVLKLLLRGNLGSPSLLKSSSRLNLKRSKGSLKILPAPVSLPGPPVAISIENLEIKETGNLQFHEFVLPQSRPDVEDVAPNFVNLCPRLSSLELGTIRNCGREVTLSLDGDPSRAAVTVFDEQTSKVLHIQVEATGVLARFIPIVTFTSPFPLSVVEFASFACLLLNGDITQPEVTRLDEISAPISPKDKSPYVYSTRLFPQTWSSLVRSNDVLTLTIVQNISRMLASKEELEDSAIEFSIIFTFGYINSASPAPPTPLYQTPSLPEDQQFVGFESDNRSPNIYPFWFEPPAVTSFASEFDYYNLVMGTTVTDGCQCAPVPEWLTCDEFF